MRVVIRNVCVLLYLFCAAPLVQGAEAQKPHLLVLVVFDQMRGDYLERWGTLFGEGGFARLTKDGAWFNNCHYPYAVTQTGPGHASMLTGCTPDQHGIVTNQWYDRQAAEVVNCSESARYVRVPTLPKSIEPEVFKEQPKKIEDKIDDDPKFKPKGKLAGSPDRMLAPTIGDALKEATGGKAKIVGLSFKDRSALLPVGKTADAVYWVDSRDGMLVTSSVYRDSVHPWVAEFNKERVVDRWFGEDWTRSRPDLDYDKLVGPDQVTGESKGIKQGVTFPHPTDGGLKKPGKSYYEALFTSPFGNDMMLELVKRAVVAEKIGMGETTDLLVVSFSSNDAIGHNWGPDSQEVLDVTLRSDRVLAEFLTFLDKQVGSGKYLLAMTADHGICPLPEVTGQKGIFAKRISGKKLVAAAEEHLRSKFDKKDTNLTLKSRWIENVQPPWVYLNTNLIEARGLQTPDVAKELASFLSSYEGIERTFTRADLAAEFPNGDPIGQRMRRSYHPDRCGDVGWVVKPFCLIDILLTGTNHGSPHPYDTYVPLLFYGPGIKAGIRKEATVPQTIAAVFATAAGIKPPKLASYPVPEGLFEGK